MAGNILVTLALLASVFSMIMYYLSYKGYKNTINLGRLGYHAMAIFVIAASALLLYAILTHQYEYKYIYSYSGSGLPFGLLMSTFYAGQEGSFMLWVLFSSIIGLILLEYTSKRGDLEPRVMMLYSLISMFLLLMVTPLLKSPFEYIWADPTFINIENINRSLVGLPFVQNFIFADQSTNQQFIKVGKELYSALLSNGISLNEFIIQGKGLNPLLQNFWMQIHPPILFVGFALSAVPFVFAISALIKNEYQSWIKQSLPWLLSAMMVLGLAIMLGGYWAYGVLGWGGWWGWDPVENSSLVPWIVGVALIHTMLIQKKTFEKGKHGRFVKTNLILAIMTFILVIYSTFLTRSGILSDSSVHSFVSPGMLVYTFLLLFIITFTLIGIGGIIYRWKNMSEEVEREESVLSRELALFTGSAVLIASAIIILVGTSAPIFGSSVEIRFYNELNLPIAIIIGIVNGLSLLLKWKVTEKGEMWKQSRFSLITTVVASLLVILIGQIYDLMLIIFTVASLFALFVNLEIAYRIILGRKLFLGASISHIGVAIFFLGIIATGGFTQDKRIDLERGKTVEVFGHSLTFTGYKPIGNGSKYAFNVEVKKGDNADVVSPVMYFSDFNNGLMREPDILNKFTSDFYISPLGYEDGTAQDNHNHGETAALGKGEAYEYNGSRIYFTEFNFPQESMDAMMRGEQFAIGAKLDITYNGETYQVEPKMRSGKEGKIFVGAEIPEANLKIDLINLNAGGKVDLEFSALDEAHDEEEAAIKTPKEVLSIEASVKPFIGLIWWGTIIIVIGFVFSTVRRKKESIR